MASNTFLEYEQVLAYIKKGRLGGGAYFEDGIRKVHYVLVLTMTAAYTNLTIIGRFIRSLEDMGLEFEQDLGITVPVIFIKIHLPDSVTELYLETYGIRQEFIEDFDYSDLSETCSTFKTPLQKKNVFKDVKIEELSLTKVKIIDKLLKQISFGMGKDKKGIQKLVNQGIFQDYYALHDGNIQFEYWHNDDLLNDRSLLAKYWAGYNVWFKSQPLDLINKYYGSEVAFYFAWCALYNLMLVPLAIIGLILTIVATTSVLTTSMPDFLTEICNSSQLTCGLCMHDYGCAQTKLSDTCTDHAVLAILQYPGLVAYAILVCIWGAFFNKMWKRKENTLKVRWNLLDSYVNEDIVRVEYLEKAISVRINNGQIIERLSKKSKYIRIAAGAVAFSFILSCIVAFTYAKQYIYLFVKVRLLKAGYDINTGFFMSEIHSYGQAGFTILFSVFVNKLVFCITKMITPRTQDTHDKILMFMTLLLDLFNNYFPIVHTAFIKNMQFNVPFNQGLYLLRADSCDPLPCVIPLFVQVMILMTLKVVAEKILVISYPKVKKLIKYYMTEQLKKSPMPQYEEEYTKSTSVRTKIDNNFSLKAIQYGMLISFTYSFPLAPLCALIDNVLTMRMEAVSLVYNSRRPAIYRNKHGIGDWYSVLLTLTIIGTYITVILIAFETDYVATNMIRAYNSSYVSYIDKVFSEFWPHYVFGPNKKAPDLPNTCLYRGHYYPPDHSRKYTLNAEYWYYMNWKLVVVLALEMFTFFTMYFFDLVFPIIPAGVKKKKYIDRTNLDNKYNKRFNKNMDMKYETERPNDTEIYQIDTTTTLLL